MSENDEVIRVELPRRWREVNEEDKAEYVIKVVDFDEEANVITRLRLSRIYRPLGFGLANRVEINYDIHYNGSEVTVAITKIKCSWNGTGTETLATIVIKEGIREEDPWFTDPQEIDDMVSKLGVSKTCKAILEVIRDVADYYLDWEE
jgi:hypothetical protein